MRDTNYGEPWTNLCYAKRTKHMPSIQL